MKTCFKCGESKELDHYYKHPQMLDGHLNKCKDCTKRDAKKRDVPRTCFTCEKEFLARATEVKRGGAKTCSRECYYERLRLLLDKKFAVKESYYTIHKWVYKNKGKPTKCENCGDKKAKRYEWANISGLYKQDLNDWKRLCKPCHHKYDNISDKLWHKRRTGKHSEDCVATGVLI